VVVAVMLETTLLALIGGAIGGLIAWLLFNGFEASMMAGSVSKLSFNLAVSPNATVGGHQMGAGHRLRQRSLPGLSRGQPSGNDSAAGVVTPP
jgi:hypothetical protein